MTLFLQYNVNNIRDGACHLWWPSVLSVIIISESVCTEQESTEFRTPLCVILATPLMFRPYSHVDRPFNGHNYYYMRSYVAILAI